MRHLGDPHFEGYWLFLVKEWDRLAGGHGVRTCLLSGWRNYCLWRLFCGTATAGPVTAWGELQTAAGYLAWMERGKP